MYVQGHMTSGAGVETLFFMLHVCFSGL